MTGKISCGQIVLGVVATVALTPIFAVAGVAAVPILGIKTLIHAGAASYYKRNASSTAIASVKQLKNEDKRLSSKLKKIDAQFKLIYMAKCLPFGLIWATVTYEGNKQALTAHKRMVKADRAQIRSRLD